MRFLLISSLLFFFIGCCKEEPTVAVDKKCKVISASSSFGYYKFFNYVGDKIAGYTNNNSSTTSVNYIKDTLTISLFDNKKGPWFLNKYHKKSDILIDVSFKSYFPTPDTSKSSFRLKDGLIISHIYTTTLTGGNKITDSTTYLYYPDYTLKESRSKGFTIIYEYYDIIDSHSIYIDDNNYMAVLTQYFNLNTKFKILKKTTLVSCTRTDVNDYTYSFDAEKKVVSSIMNTKNFSDTIQYRYLCE